MERETIHTGQIKGALTLGELNERVTALINGNASVSDIWVVAELSDLRGRPGSHCYMELVEKDEEGKVCHRMRATVWASTFSRINQQFFNATGAYLASGMKVMLKVTVNFHTNYGLAASVSYINPEYTLGSLLAKRKAILDRLEAEGVLTMNRDLAWSETPLRIAVISARSAAGFGDFVNELYHNSPLFNFQVKLFEATMQGESCPQTIISALEEVASSEQKWDCVAIIRGGGATTDFAAFESYELASNIAQFPLPIIVGIGHERDVTVLDYVANTRVKTPTAAADWLVGKLKNTYDRVSEISREIFSTASEILAGNNEILARYETSLPLLPGQAISMATQQIDLTHPRLMDILRERTLPELDLLSQNLTLLRTFPKNLIEKNMDLLKSHEKLVQVLSPEATLKRGYSITRLNGKILMDSSQVSDGMVISSTLASGSLESVVMQTA